MHSGTSHLGLEEAARVRDTLLRLLIDLHANLDSVSVMCMLQETVNNDLLHDAMVIYIKV